MYPTVAVVISYLHNYAKQYVKSTDSLASVYWLLFVDNASEQLVNVLAP